MSLLRSGGRRDGERGQVLVLFTMVLIVILGFAALVVDLGMLRNNRQTLANTMDSGALAGGTLLPVDGRVPGAAAAINALIVTTVSANFPGLPKLGIHDHLQMPDRRRHEQPTEAVHLA